MAEYSVKTAHAARTDLYHIARYISKELVAPAAALKMLKALDDAVSKLSDMPHSKPLVADDRLSSMGYRKLIVKNYIVFFTVHEKEKLVYVERILYGRRDWTHIL